MWFGIALIVSLNFKETNFSATVLKKSTLGARGFFFVAKLRLLAAKPLILPREKKTPLDAAVTNLTSMRF